MRLPSISTLFPYTTLFRSGLNARTVRYVHTILHAVLKDALTLAVSERGLEPLRPIRAPGPQPGASAYSATPTWLFKSSQSDRLRPPGHTFREYGEMGVGLGRGPCLRGVPHERVELHEPREQGQPPGGGPSRGRRVLRPGVGTRRVGGADGGRALAGGRPRRPHGRHNRGLLGLLRRGSGPGVAARPARRPAHGRLRRRRSPPVPRNFAG